MPEPIVQIQGLSKTYRSSSLRHRFATAQSQSKSSPEVLCGIDLEIREGEVLGLLGPNGAGKTTLVEILATLLLPTRGSVSVCGHDVVDDAPAVRKLVSYCASATDNFYPRLSAESNLEFFAVLNEISPGEARARIQSTLEHVGLQGKGKVPFQHYSEGMKQRLAIARALLKEPRLVLLDEPTRSLDPPSQGEIRRLIRGLLTEKLGTTVLLVTHSLDEAQHVCDRLAILDRGKIVALGAVDEIKHWRGAPNLATAFELAVGDSACQ